MKREPTPRDRSGRKEWSLPSSKWRRRRFDVKNALNYLIRKKLLNFANAAEKRAKVRPGRMESRIIAREGKVPPLATGCSNAANGLLAEQVFETRCIEHTKPYCFELLS